MVSPWGGQRHRSWASDTVIFAVIFVIVLIVTVTVDQLNGPEAAPAYLTGLLGASGAALFGAAGSDKSKREREISDTAERAESKADDALGQAASSRERESEPSLHQDDPPDTAEIEGDAP